MFLSFWIQLGAGDVPEHSLRSDILKNGAVIAVLYVGA